MQLHELKLGQIATITNITHDDAVLENKLREVGFAEGDEVEKLQRGALFLRDPICVRLNQTMMALRIAEASAIYVDLKTETTL